MRKTILVIILLVLFLPINSYADSNIDLKALTDDELIDLIADTRLEYFTRRINSDNRQIIYDTEKLKITLTGQYEERFSSLVALDCIVENHTDNVISIFIDSIDVNGFQINDTERFVCLDFKPNKKIKGSIVFDFTRADINGYKGLKDIILTLKVCDSNSNDILFTTDEILITFPNS